MTTVLDLKIPAKVTAILAKYGVSATFTVNASETYSPSTGIVTVVAGTPVTVKATPPDQYARRFVNGDTILAGDARILVAGEGLTFVPEAGQKVSVAGGSWKVVDVLTHLSGDSVAAYELQVRK